MSARLIWGVFGGIITIAFYVCLYFYDITLFVSREMFYAGLIPMVLAMVLGILYIKGKSARTFEFKEVLTIGFYIFVTADIMYWVFYIAMINCLDPGIVEIQRIEAVIAAKNYYGEQHPEVQRISNSDFSMNWRLTLYSVAQGLIGGFLISVLLGFLMRDK